MNNKKIRQITGLGILTALLVVLGIISNYVTIESVNINLTLVPIVIGACIYGPFAGLFLGLVDGIITIVAPATLAIFIPYNPVLTILLCLVKTGAAGYLSGLFFKLLRKKNSIVAAIVASVSAPIINTSIFLIGAICFFLPLYEGNGQPAIIYLLVATLSINFVIELFLSSFLSPTVHRVIKYATRNYDIGDVYEDEEVDSQE